MNCKKLLIMGAIVVGLCMGGSAFAQCSANLADGLGPTGGTYNFGETINYVITLQVPASPSPPALPNCTLTDVTVYFFPPGDLTPGESPCANLGLGTVVASGLTLAPGDPLVVLTGLDDEVLDYTIEAATCDDSLTLTANMAVTFFIEDAGDVQCDEKEAVNTVNATDTPLCDIEGPTEICDTVPEVLYCTANPADTYSWVVTGDGVIDGLDDGPCIVVNPTGPGGYNVQLTVCNDNGTVEGCCSTCDVDVTVVPEPICGIEGLPVVCEDSVDVVYSSLGTADSYSWVVIGDGVIDGPADGPTVMVDPTAGPGGYLVQLQVCNGAGEECCSECNLEVHVIEAPDCVIEGPESVCEDVELVEYCSGAPADTFLWTVTGDAVPASPDNGPCFVVSPTGTGTYTVELTVCYITLAPAIEPEPTDCCNSCELVVDIIEIPDCSIEGPKPVCEGSTGNVYCSADTADSYEWGISGNGDIIGPTDGPCVTVDAGAAGTYTLTLVVCNESDLGPCCSRCELVVTVDECGVLCTFTQGFYGNAGGKSCGGMTTTEIIEAALLGGPVIVGLDGRSIRFDSAECIILRLPCGGKPRALPEGLGNVNCADMAALKSAKLLKGKDDRINNVLVGQVVALTLNLRVSDTCLGEDSADLATWVLPEEFCTVPYDDPEACPQHYTIPAALVGKTAQQLLAAANAALAGDETYSISDIYTAATAINEGFDEGRLIVPCSLLNPDLIVTELEVLEYNSEPDPDVPLAPYWISYSYTVKNIGCSAVDLNGVSVQAMLSDDDVFGGPGDIPAGGVVLSTVEHILQPDDSFPGAFAANTTEDPATFGFLTLKVDWGEVVDESDEANNTAAAEINGD